MSALSAGALLWPAANSIRRHEMPAMRRIAAIGANAFELPGLPLSGRSLF
jgi:hypothetical protein